MTELMERLTTLDYSSDLQEFLLRILDEDLTQVIQNIENRKDWDAVAYIGVRRMAYERGDRSLVPKIGLEEGKKAAQRLYLVLGVESARRRGLIEVYLWPTKAFDEKQQLGIRPTATGIALHGDKK